MEEHRRGLPGPKRLSRREDAGPTQHSSGSFELAPRLLSLKQGHSNPISSHQNPTPLWCQIRFHFLTLNSGWPANRLPRSSCFDQSRSARRASILQLVAVAMLTTVAASDRASPRRQRICRSEGHTKARWTKETVLYRGRRTPKLRGRQRQDRRRRLHVLDRSALLRARPK